MSGKNGVQYVGFWRRFLAAIIDTVLVFMITMPLLVAIYGSEYFSLKIMPLLTAIYGTEYFSPGLDGAGASSGLWDFLLSWIFPAVAVIVFWIYRSATPGKMAVNAKIVDAETGGKPSAGQLIGRYLAYYVSILPLMLGFIWVAFDSRKQGWHDKLAGTVVVRGR